MGKFHILLPLQKKIIAGQIVVMELNTKLIVNKVFNPTYLCKILFVHLCYFSGRGKGKKLLWQINRVCPVNLPRGCSWENKESSSNNLTGWMLLMRKMLWSMEMRGKAFTNRVFFLIVALPFLLKFLVISTASVSPSFKIYLLLKVI